MKIHPANRHDASACRFKFKLAESLCLSKFGQVNLRVILTKIGSQYLKCRLSILQFEIACCPLKLKFVVRANSE